jgi:uncharacterized protein YbjT (DUF2867 family)
MTAPAAPGKAGMEAQRRALVVGGTGLVGRELLGLLRDDARYAQVTSLARREAAPRAKVETRVVSFDQLDSVILPDADDAFCCLGTTRRKAGSDEAFRRVDFDYVVAFARAARRAGVTRFLLISAIGADPRSRTLYLRVKGNLEVAVQTVGFPVLGIVRPSFIYGHRDERRPGESIVIAAGHALAPLMVGPLRPYRPVSALQVASALARLATTAAPGLTIWSREIAGVAREKSCRDS